MFTGIIESLGTVEGLDREGGNLHLHIQSSLTPELKIDQSVAHNGTCLTVVAIDKTVYTVTAIAETLEKTTLSSLEKGHRVNLERAMILGARLDGHLVQGHVDQTGEVVEIKEENGSWRFTIAYDSSSGNLTVEKGSITINGVSLTVIESLQDRFSVAIIPYTYAHTTFNRLKLGDGVNLEFDVLGKYVARFMRLQQP